MINPKENYVEWATLVAHLEEAHDHLGELLERLTPQNGIEEEEFAVDLGHVYAHLNRVWNGRNTPREWTDEEFEKFTAFPTDIYPVG